MNINKNNGSTLILVLIAATVLSVICIASLDRSIAEGATSRNFLDDKTTFFQAEDGISRGITAVKATNNPISVYLNYNTTQTISNNIGGTVRENYTIITGEMQDTSPQPVKAFLGFKPPPPKGMSIEMLSDTGIATTAWDLNVTAKKDNAKKHIQAVVVLMSIEY